MDLYTDPQLHYSKKHFGQTTRLIKYLSCGRNGETHLAIDKDDINIIYNAYKTHRSHSKLMRDLRGVLIVVKFAKGLTRNSKLGGLCNEVDFLSWEQLQRTDADRSRVTCMIDSYIEGGTQWLKMPYVRGSDLLGLVKHSWKKLSIGLQWHIALQITELLLYLHFGVTDIDTMVRPDWWPLQVFCDLHSGNILVSAPDNESYYPGLVLADFGNAGRFGSKLHSDAREKDFRKERLHDYRCMGSTLEGMFIASKIGKASHSCKHCNCPLLNQCPHPECEECIRIARTYGLLPKLTKTEGLLLEWARAFASMPKKTDDELLAFLTEWVKVAKRERLAHYEPIHAEIMNVLQQPAVGDEELLEAAGLLRLLD